MMCQVHMPTRFQCLSYATTYPVQIPRTDLQLRVHTFTLRFSLTLRYSRLSGPVVLSENKQESCQTSSMCQVAHTTLERVRCSISSHFSVKYISLGSLIYQWVVIWQASLENKQLITLHTEQTKCNNDATVYI